MKKIFVILLLPFVLYSQEVSDKNPSVELPEFVITGKELMNLQQTKKPEAGLLTIISENFIKPVLNPEELELGEIEGPQSFNLNLRDSFYYNNGIIKTLFGINTLPNVSIRISSPYKSGLFEGHLDGRNIRPYVKNAERYFLNAGAGLSLFSGYENLFLPGAEYNITADFNSGSYKLFAGSEPALKRNLYQGELGASVKNIYSDRFQFNLKTGYRYTMLKDEEFEEGHFSVDGLSYLNFGNLNGGILLNYRNQMFSDSNTSNSYYNYILIRPSAGFEFSKFLKASFGITYSHALETSFTTLFASVGLRLNRNLTLFGEFAPGGEFIVASEFLDQNIYFNPQNKPNIFVKKTVDLKGMLKYEYSRYFEISGGFRYKSYNNLPYFPEMNPDGTFTLNPADAELYGLFLNMMFHKGPYGYFYASTDIQEVKDEKNSIIPYFPSLISSLTYGYDFAEGLNTEANLIYRSGIYTNIANTEKINAYINLEINLSYSISKNLKLIAGVCNILNRKNYIWSNYREIPLDLSAGISYIW